MPGKLFLIKGRNMHIFARDVLFSKIQLEPGEIYNHGICYVIKPAIQVFSILKNWWTYQLFRYQTFTLCSISNNSKRNTSDELWKLGKLRKISYWRKRLLFDCLKWYIFHRERFMLLKQFCNFIILTYVRKISLKWKFRDFS